jgi:hypothetical protein
MTLHEKIKSIYPSLIDDDFGRFGTILLQNDSDGKGDYIAKWEHTQFQRPTQEQLDAIN